MADERRAPETRAEGRAFWPRVIVIAALGLLLRLFVVLTIPTQPVSDFAEYVRRAHSLAHFGRLQLADDQPDAAHPPLYPLWLAAFISVGSNELSAIKFGNCVLGVGTIMIGAGLVRRLWGFRAGIAAALLFTFLPRLLLMPLIVASENLFSPLLLLFMGAATRRWQLIAEKRGSRRSASAAILLAAEIGLLIALLALTRTVGYFLALVWLAGMVLARVRARTILVELVVILAVQHLVMLPWAIRNEQAVGRFTFLNTVGGVGLYAGNNPHAVADWRPWQNDLERARPGILSRGPAEIDDAARQEAVHWIRGHPGRAARLYLKRLWLILKQDTVAAWWAIYAKEIVPPFPGRDVLSEHHPLEDHRAAVFRTLRIADAFLLACAFGGFWLLFGRAHRSRSYFDRALAVGFLAAVAYFPLFSAPIATNGRQRWPSEDLSVPVAALFLTLKRGRARAPNTLSSAGGPASEENFLS